MASAYFTMLLICFRLSITTVLGHPKQIPLDASKLEAWIGENMREFTERKAQLAQGKNDTVVDHVLAAAEDGFRVITVRKDGRGDFKTITDAVKSIPSGNTRRVVKITVERSKDFVTFFGDPFDMPKIVFNGTALHFGTVNSATVAVESDYFVAANVAFVNSAPMPDGKRLGAQAVAMRISGDKAAFHNCKFIGYQDTLCDDKGRHFFKDCYIQGTVDFIFGNGKSLYLRTTIVSVANGLGVITAQAREQVNDDSGFTFVHCNITGSGDTYLGRAWKERPRVLFAYTYMGTLINSQGWAAGEHSQSHKTVYYGEYKCMGPGASSSGRVKFAKLLSEAEAKPFLSMTYLNGNKWLLPLPNL
ncbi:putative pectinesterase 63 [Citrus sinensis]|uniref:Pectinesterase 63 n=1 Tax=Citrus sinensis TaxID=2711 RepID=A0ACB8P3R2_CITSI|nr:putative pectinesterase 63 [Citrus sinensis]